MARFITRLVMVLLALATVSANLAACGGWQATAAARMACCAEGAGCPMHRGGHETSGKAAPSQSAADACCASSEQTDATITFQAYALPALAVAVVTLPEPHVAYPSRYQSSNGESPPPDDSVPRHLLLSVFLL